MGILIWIAGSPPVPTQSTTPPAPAEANPAKDRELAQTVCGTCHVFPEPALFERYQWGIEILPRMSYLVGFQLFDYKNHPGGEIVRAAGVFPTNQVISFDQWRTVINYYLEHAPSVEPPPPPQPQIEPTLPGFTVELVPARDSPQITMTAIDSVHRQIFVADDNQLEVLNARGELRQRIPLTSPAAHALFRNQAPALLTLLGSFNPSDEPLGQIVALTQSASMRLGEPVLSHLPRPVKTLETDFDGDGRQDLLVCGFGNYVGRLAWHRALPDGRWEEHILDPAPGAVGAGIGDFDGDGKPDVAVLMAQARESLVLHLNRGLNNWQKIIVREFHPAWGASSLQVMDFNGDGRLDLIAANGDNADSDSGRFANARPPRRAWHGIRLYEQNTDRSFTEKWFLPMNGAYRAMGADFNQDGLMDVAAVSYFPDYERTPQEGFVLYLQASPGKFRACSMPESLSGRWITLDCGDLDADGDVDIVLASHPNGPGRVPTKFATVWAGKGNRLLILRNQRR
jgi:hypothetical protein